MLAPAATILLASAISKAGLNRKHFNGIAVCSAALFAAFFAVNIFGSQKSFYLVSATSIGQRISHIALITFWAISLCLLLWLAFRKIFAKRLDKKVFCVFLALCISFNLLMVSNYFTQTEYSFVLKSAVEELEKNGFERPFYSWNEEIPFYLGFSSTQDYFKGEREMALLKSVGVTEDDVFFDLDDPAVEPLIKSKGGTAALLNYPRSLTVEKFPAHKRVIELLEKECGLRKRFAMLDAETLIFDCKK